VAIKFVNVNILSRNKMSYDQESGAIINTTLPAFLAYLPSNDNNVTGNGTLFTIGSVTALTEVFDLGGNFNTNGTFTAPVTGKYLLMVHVNVTGCTNASQIDIYIITTARTYRCLTTRGNSALDIGGNLSSVCDMTAGDTATFGVATAGEAGATNDVVGSATLVTSVSGFLVG
jgi:hypothetical protein